MAEHVNDSRTDAQPSTILIAHVTVYLVDDTSFELYPFVDENDVKAKVSELVEGWAKSGFLLRGSRLIPWQRVKLLEATSVEEITHAEAQQRMMVWQAEDQRVAVQNFWKTKKEQKKDGDKAEGDKDVEHGGH